MDKILSLDFALVMLIMAILFLVHEYGHFLAYLILKIPTRLRRSLFAPGIDPKETVSVKRWQGLIIALGGFILSLVIVIPLFIIGYKHDFVILIGAIAGSIVDFIWALSMIGNKMVTLRSRG